MSGPLVVELAPGPMTARKIGASVWLCRQFSIARCRRGTAKPGPAWYDMSHKVDSSLGGWWRSFFEKRGRNE